MRDTVKDKLPKWFVNDCYDEAKQCLGRSKFYLRMKAPSTFTVGEVKAIASVCSGGHSVTKIFNFLNSLSNEPG